MKCSSWLFWRTSYILIAATLFAVPESEACRQQLEQCHLLNQNEHSEMEDKCRNWLEVVDCANEYFQSSCVSNGITVGFIKNRAIANYCTNNCSSASTEEQCRDTISPPPTSDPTPERRPSNCSSLPSAVSPDPLGDPSFTFTPSSPECTLPPNLTYYRQHCSVFSLSHVRPFGDRSLGVETCSLPGKWFLFKHEHLSVVIEGTHAEASGGYNYTYTYISKVNVTFGNHACFEHTVSYVADVSSLSTCLTSQENTTCPSLSNRTVATSLDSLQLTVSNQSVATLQAPWLNVSIIIRRVDGYLSVTLQVPKPLSHRNDVSGLCSTGCSAVTIQENTNLPTYPCPADKLAAGLICLDLEAVLQLYDSLQEQERSISYSDPCRYDLVLTHNLSLVSLYEALAKDSLQFPDVITLTRPLAGGGTTIDPTTPTLPTDDGSFSIERATSSPDYDHDSKALSLHPTSLFITISTTLLTLCFR